MGYGCMVDTKKVKRFATLSKRVLTLKMGWEVWQNDFGQGPAS